MKQVPGENVQKNGVQLGFDHDGHSLPGARGCAWQPQNIHAAALDHMILMLGTELLPVGIEPADAKALHLITGQLWHHDSAGQPELLVLAVFALDRRQPPYGAWTDNAVPPLFARVIAEPILPGTGGVDTASSKPRQLFGSFLQLL